LQRNIADTTGTIAVAKSPKALTLRL